MFDTGEQVMIVKSPTTMPRMVGMYGVITGVVGRVHCPGLLVHSLEIAFGYDYIACECALIRAPFHNMKVRWGDCVWQPKKET